MDIDLNSDLGESFGTWRLGDDAAVLDVVTSANVACGFHAGDPRTLLSTCERAVAAGVVIGAQVGYRDLPGFGRRFIDYESADLVADLLYQLGALEGLARVAGGRVRYVKPHGALYNTIVHHEQQAAAVVEAVTRFDASLPVLGLPGSVFLAAAERAGLRTVAEAFVDRAYTPAGTLVSRREPGAVLHDPDLVAARMVRLVTRGELDAIDGSVVTVRADSLCVHGDSPGAVGMARAVRDALESAGLTVRSFT
ncbi:LamB/YcsF family protein [Cryptosporangium arvum]|uniref:5-oxoprolinase subunit A n=1 Tax=Cryptosporangium arvum DSM 44712 TaxID=927661 RepID=A0A010Z2K3_9ACTN|nr:5-oxoprolinase subunit PxpA [Cryptosporangium arvum]EXG81653.1 putative lactam utilization protein B-like protein [Cryptosporangium arvum DSM 44712]